MRKGLLTTAAAAMALAIFAPITAKAETPSASGMIIVDSNDGAGGIYVGQMAADVDAKWGTNIAKEYGEDYTVLFVGEATISGGTAAPDKTVAAGSLSPEATLVVLKGSRIAMGPSIIIKADDLGPVIALGKMSTDGIDMYRLYNPNSGEHFYTKNAGEKDALVKFGWNYEGIGWTAPAEGDPVYRMYNKNAGDHHYTMNAGERDALVKYGWTYEGIGWRSDPTKKVPVYREYNPNMTKNNHNYTANRGEHNYLTSIGWNNEGIGWYAIGGRKK